MDRTHQPFCCEIHIRGELSEAMLGAFPGLQASMRGAVTVLTGELPDQSALHGLLAQVEALGLELVGVRRHERAREESPRSCDDRSPDRR